MHKSKGWWSLAVASAILGAGCGGSGSGGAGPSNPGGGTETNLGALKVASEGQLKAPVVIASGGYTLTGLSGARITSAAFNFPPVTLAEPEVMYENSSLVTSVNRQAVMVNLVTGATYPLSNTGTTNQDPTPTIYPTGPRVATAEYDLATNGTQIFSTHRDGTGRTRLTSDSGAEYTSPAVSSSAGLIFVDGTTGEGKLRRIPVGSTVHQPLYDDGERYYSPKVSPDGSLVAFVKDFGINIHTLCVAPADGSGVVRELFSPMVGQTPIFTWLPTGEILCGINYYDTPTAGIELSRIDVPTGTLGKTFFLEHPLSSLSAAPDGVTVLASDGTATIQVLSLASESIRPFKTMESAVGTVCWGPYERARYLVGPLSWSTPQASGFLVTQKSSRLGGYVTFDATTPSGVTITEQAGGAGTSSLICTVEAADALTSVKYIASSASVNTISVVSPSSPVKGAIVACDAATGKIASIITYTTSSLTAPTRSAGNRLTFKGKFEGVWNASGENTRSGGATTVTLDAKTGALISAE